MLVSPMQGGWDILSTQIVDPHLAVDAVIAVCGHCSYLVAGVYILHVHTLHNADISPQVCMGISQWLQYRQYLRKSSGASCA